MFADRLNELVGRPQTLTPFNRWRSEVTETFGNFQVTKSDHSDIVTGGIVQLSGAGVDVMQIACDIGKVRRMPNGVRKDDRCNLTLLVQLEGTCVIEQHAKRQTLHAGACIIMDAAVPGTIHIDGTYSNHLSIALPRQIFAGNGCVSDYCHKILGTDDPLSTVVRSLVTKLLQTQFSQNNAAALRELFYAAVAQSFSLAETPDDVSETDMSFVRAEKVKQLIKENLTEPHLTPSWLASKVGVSLRTLQNDLSQQCETTLSALILAQRLELAFNALRDDKKSATRTVAEIAFSSGFNDVSYFNRCFKKAYACTPLELVTPCASSHKTRHAPVNAAE